MRCTAVRKWFWAYLDGSAPARVCRHVEVHLAGCAACAEELAQMKELELAITEAILAGPSADLSGPIMAAVGAGPVWWSGKAQAAGTPPWFLAVLVMAGSMALAGGAVLLFMLGRLLIWNWAITGLLNPVPALAAYATARLPGWFWSLWPAVQTVVDGLYAVVASVPVPVLLFAGLVLLILEAWVASQIIANGEEVLDR